MKAKTKRLARKLDDEELAKKLVAKGIDTPAKLRAVSDDALDAVLGKAARKKLRG